MSAFVRVVETRSFSAVANERGSTQSAITKQIAGLERELGVRLLTRTTRALSLTEQGAAYFEQVRRIVSELEDIEAGVRHGPGKLRGSLRIAASVGVGRIRLMPVIERFLLNNPDVRVDLKLHDGFVDLVEQGIDVAVRIGHLSDSNLIARRIGSTQRVLLARRDHPNPPASPEDLVNQDCIVYTEQATKNLWLLKSEEDATHEKHEPVSIRVTGRFQTNSTEVLRAAVIRGLGIGFAPAWLLGNELSSGEVVRVLPSWSSPPYPVHLLSPTQRRHSAKVRAFGDLVIAMWQQTDWPSS